jgi:hypothetical protein
MSAGHPHHHTDVHARQYEALLYKTWFQLALDSRPYVVDPTYDLPYVGGSSIGLARIYVDRHAYPVIRDAGLLSGLVMHERVEGILLEHGWSYEIEPFAAHLVASAAEAQVYIARGITMAEAARIYAPLIKADEHERLKRVPADLHMEPYLEPPVDARLVARMRSVMTGPAPLAAWPMAGGVMAFGPPA